MFLAVSSRDDHSLQFGRLGSAHAVNLRADILTASVHSIQNPVLARTRIATHELPDLSPDLEASPIESLTRRRSVSNPDVPAREPLSETIPVYGSEGRESRRGRRLECNDHGHDRETSDSPLHEVPNRLN